MVTMVRQRQIYLRDSIELKAIGTTGSMMSVYNMFAKVFGFLTADLKMVFKALTHGRVNSTILMAELYVIPVFLLSV